MSADLEVTPQDVQALLEAGAAVVLIDCREESEWRTARIEGARLVPLGELTAKVDDVAEELADEAGPVVVYCHHGIRSRKAAMLLQSRGVQARSMAGGIDRWSVEVNRAVPRY